MRTKSELYQAALRTVAVRRQTARALAQDARAQAEAAIPGLLHAEEEVRVRGCAVLWRAPPAPAEQKPPQPWQMPEKAAAAACPKRPPGGCAGAKVPLCPVPGYRHTARAHLHLCPPGNAASAPGRDRGAFQFIGLQL